MLTKKQKEKFDEDKMNRNQMKLIPNGVYVRE